MAQKILRTKFVAICDECAHIFDLNDRLMRNQDIEKGHVPFGAKSSNSTVLCPKCNNSEFRIHFEYKNIYRIRCLKCNQMFDAEETYQHKCSICQDKYMKAIVGFGA